MFAVPGHPLDPRAEGTNQLLKNGATLATGPADVLEALAPIARLEERGFTEPMAPQPARRPAEPAPLPSAEERERVLAALGPHPIDADEIVRSTGLGARDVRILLMELDLAGRIERHGSQLVSRIEPLET